MNTNQATTKNTGMKKQLNRAFHLLLLFSALSFSTAAQEVNHRLSPANKTEPETLDRLLFVADSIGHDSIKLQISDIDVSPSPGSFIDLYYLVKIKLYSQYKDVTKSALLSPLSLNLDIVMRGLDGDASAFLLQKNVDLEISPQRDLSTATYYLSAESTAPYDAAELEKIEVRALKSQLAAVASESFLEDIILEVYVDRGRYFTPSSTEISPEIVSYNPADTSNKLKRNEAVIQWDAIQHPTSYEIEWLHIPYNSTTGITSVDYDFSKNATRLLCEENNLPLSLIHHNGFIVVRGRSKRPSLNKDQSGITASYQYSDWSLPLSGNIATSNAAVIAINNDTTASISAINWQYRGTYAGEGKKKELVNYFDGSQRQRQTNTLLYNRNKATALGSGNSASYSSTVITQESYYNFNGEEMISFLPAPLIHAGDIAYQQGINKLSTEKLNRGDYDSLAYAPSLALTDDSVGAAQYYSPENQLLNSELRAEYIPNANGYPYSRVEYMADGSGRLKVQYSPGANYATNETMGSRYAYVRPTRGELEHLFGTNIGDVAYYKKDISIDPNGVMSIAYKDQKDRVVATSISGTAEGRSQMTDIPYNALLFSEDLLLTGADRFVEADNAYDLSFPIYVPTTATYKFSYGFDIDAYKGCSTASICYDCRYRFTFQLYDEDYDLVLEATDTLVNFQQSTCTNESYAIDAIDSVDINYTASINGDSLLITLPGIKGYTVYKRLELIVDSLETYAEAYLENQECGIRDYEYFEMKELNKIDFSVCREDYSLEPKDFCRRIYDSLRSDFLLPDGEFVAGLTLNSSFVGDLYDRLQNTLGCNRFNINGCFGDKTAFLYDLLARFSESTTDFSFLMEKQNELASYLVQFHPNYCQYQVCLQKYEYYESFDYLLERSNNLTEFVAMGYKQGLFDTDTLDFSWDTTLKTFISVQSVTNDTLATEHFLLPFDPVLQFVDPKDSLEHFEQCVEGEKDGVAFYSMLVFDDYVRYDCTPDISVFDRDTIYQTYFNNPFNGCERTDTTFSLQQLVKYTAINLGLDTISKGYDDETDRRWEVFKNYYLNIRNNMVEEMLSSLICVNPSYYVISPVCSTKTDTSGNPYIISEGDTTIVGCLPVNLGCSTDVESNFWSTAYHRTTPWRESLENSFASAGDMEDTTKSAMDSTINIETARMVFALLRANTCLKVSDSSAFVQAFEADSFVCNPFSYINKHPALTCDLEEEVNLASIQIDMLKIMKSDSTESPRYTCDDRKFKDFYTWNNLMDAHTWYVNKSGFTVPKLTSAADISFSDSLQRIYTHVMNAYLAIDLGFGDYYDFIQLNSPDQTTSVFDVAVSWDESTRAQEIKEVVIQNTDSVDYRSLEEDSLFNLINKYLTAATYDTLNRSEVFLGMGEQDLANNQNKMYWMEDGKTDLAPVLDTFNNVFAAIRESLPVFGALKAGKNVPTNGMYIQGGYDTIASLSTILLDRAVLYANGTIWIRTVNKSDSSFYKDYYFYIEPYNYFYGTEDIDTFTTIRPVFDKEQIDYARLTFTFGSRDYEVLASSSTPLGQAELISLTILDEPMGIGAFPVEDACEDLLYKEAIALAKKKYSDYVQGIKDTFQLNYVNHCTNRNGGAGMSNRHLNMTYASPERQFTLYYYDQADNLVMTVPPGGVDNNFVYDADTIAKIDNYRAGLSAEKVLPAHSKATTYKYNSDNQLIEQNTPNGGLSNFWYDQAGRLVLSQNAKQAVTNRYAYTFYDAQSRITEAGEVCLNELNAMTWADIHTFIQVELLDTVPTTLRELIEEKGRNEVVKTFYDEAVLSEPTVFTQENLRSRVATQAYYPNFDTLTSTTAWEFATHYSYDATGNVKTLLNDYYQNGRIDNLAHRFKRIDYAFDVISGNVKQVYYQTGESDAFYHRYFYDAENRITSVETSRDGLIWDEDATYDYYLHGPLARTELGSHKVQGIDYAYTLQGWLKSVNAAHKGVDMGQDHSRENVFAEDAFGYTLQYNQNDYASIGSTNAVLIASNTGSLHSDLYNGNISAISQHRQDTSYGRVYYYDQLNRITDMIERTVDEDSLKWDPLLENGNWSAYEYDPNGNLTNLKRYEGLQERLMDDLHYNYINGKDQLSSVDDTVAVAAFGQDIDQQVSNNYSYDAIGNLVADTAENICKIQWYPNGKVKRIIRDFPSRERANLFFEYDGLGNRVKKTSSFIEADKLFLRTVYYVRDAQGNVMATYEERDCDFFEGNDSLGLFYYQYTETYGAYTQDAMDQTSKDSVLTYLLDTFSLHENLHTEAGNLLDQVSGIRDTIMDTLVVADYLELYPSANTRLINDEPFFYGEYLFDNEDTAFIQLVNDKREAYIYYFIAHDSVYYFYNNLNAYYTAEHGVKGAIDDYYAMNQDLATAYVTDTTFMRDLTGLDSADYSDVLAGRSNHSTAVSNLSSWMGDLSTLLTANNYGSTTTNLIDKVNAALMLVTYSSDDMATIFDNVNTSKFYAAISAMSGIYKHRLNTVMYHFYLVDAAYVNTGNLINFKPGAALNWAEDTAGVLIQYFVHTDVAYQNVYDGIAAYVEGKDLYNRDIYFSSTSVIRSYAAEALERNALDTNVTNALIANDSATLVNINQVESLGSLIHYYTIHYPYQVLEQNYYKDTLNAALGALSHLTPIDYARELEDSIAGITYAPLGGCSPHETYLLPERFEVYGSSRLGTMDAKEARREADNRYNRNLGAKNYELSDHLGNVVATISDKKLHPQELLTSGQQNVDTTIGYQAQLTGRYDYYPFGMEIMSRSGDFEAIDYSTDISEILYEGLLTNCSAYSLENTAEDVINCDSDTNIYGQDYVGSIEFVRNDCCWSNRSKLDFYIDFTVADLIPNLDTAKTYKLEMAYDAQGRLVYCLDCHSPTSEELTSASAGEGAAELDVRIATDKVVTLLYKGITLDTASVNGVFSIDLRASWGHASYPYTADIDLKEIKLSQINENTTVPLAKRMNEAYTYGFNGMIRSDEVSGSGNSYSADFREYDSRLGRWWSLDPLMAKYPHQSAYAAFNNNPIYFKDPTGLEGDPPGDPKTHQIQKGETLTGIAKKYGTTVEDLASRNNISDPNKIFAGSTLNIADPSSGGSTASTDDGNTNTTPPTPFTGIPANTPVTVTNRTIAEAGWGPISVGVSKVEVSIPATTQTGFWENSFVIPYSGSPTLAYGGTAGIFTKMKHEVSTNQAIPGSSIIDAMNGVKFESFIAGSIIHFGTTTMSNNGSNVGSGPVRGIGLSYGVQAPILDISTASEIKLIPLRNRGDSLIRVKSDSLLQKTPEGKRLLNGL
jgi:RHS repeat-associated protein